jgi:hypothetical protein
MKKTSELLTLVVLFMSCACNTKKPQNKEKQDTTIAFKNPNLNTVVHLKTGSNDVVDVTFDDVLSALRASYNKIEKIDKQVIDGKDTLQLHETYYCLHDSSLKVPGRYMGPWGRDTTKDFIANTFAIKVIVIKNNDTILNKAFKKREFNKVVWNRLKQYAIIFNPDYIGYNTSKGEFALGYSITIPLTDVGAPAEITVDKKGNYKILDEYATFDGYTKD